MTEEETVQVDPSELSEEVVEGLVEEGALDEEDARKYGDEVWFEEVETPEPIESESFLSEVSSSVSELFNVWRSRTAFFTLSDVSRTDNDKVKIKFSNPNCSNQKLTLEPDSPVLGNLLRLARVDNPKELEGGRLAISDNRLGKPDVVIPKNVSFYGRLRYKGFAFLNQIAKKTEIESVNFDSGYGLFLVTCLAWIPGIIGAQIIESLFIAGLFLMLPALLLTPVSAVVVLYGIFRGMLLLVREVCEDDFKELGTYYQ